jgi:caa(3)-type oxidase subunit IV
MAVAERQSPSHLTIWVWLVLLVIVGLALVALPLSKVTVVSLIFTVAVVKAALVVRHYMHLREVPALLYLIAGIPVLLVLGMALTLLPDIAFRP